MLTSTWITSVYFVCRRCICSYLSFTSEKISHSHTGGLYIFKGNNYILWSFCLQKMFVKRCSEICCCHCNGTWLAMKWFRHLKIIVFFQRGCVWGKAESGEKMGSMHFTCTSWSIVFVSSNTSLWTSHVSVWDLPGHILLLVPGDLCCISPSDEACLMLISSMLKFRRKLKHFLYLKVFDNSETYKQECLMLLRDQ